MKHNLVLVKESVKLWAIKLGQTIQDHSNPSLCHNHWCQSSWNWMVLWRPIRTSRTNTNKDVPSIAGDWNAKVGSQDISEATSKSGLGVQNETRQRATEFCQENALVAANTLFQQRERLTHTWTPPDGQHWKQTDCSLCSQRWRSSMQTAKPRRGADCSSDHELLIAKFILKL